MTTVSRAADPALLSAAEVAGPQLPRWVLPARPVQSLLDVAEQGLAEATLCSTATQRYAAAHLAALRAAAAVLAVRARPVRTGRRSRPTSVWVLLQAVAPELGEWAGFFAAGAAKRSAAEAGRSDAVTAREADDLLRDAAAFVDLVTDLVRR